MKPILRNLFRNKETGKTDSKIYNVVGDTVTLNKNHVVKQHNASLSTIFKEVEVVPYTEAISPELLVASRQPVDIPMPENDFFNGILKTLKQYIEEAWSPNKHHLIQHSSGFDSRVMSTIIRQIYLERGDGWLGDISFVAWGRERDQAEKIVRAEGWKHEPFYSLPKNDKYFETGLDFGYAWRGLNGASGYPINNPHWAFRALQNKGVISQNPFGTQVWAASWFNETMKAKADRSGFEAAFFKTYYSNSCAQHGAAYLFEFVQPLLNPATIEHMVRARVSLPGSHSDIRKRLVKHVAPSLVQFSREDPATINIPKQYVNRAMSNYRKSSYGKGKNINATGKMRFHPWWAQWSTASLVEHLIEEGVRVK